MTPMHTNVSGEAKAVVVSSGYTPMSGSSTEVAIQVVNYVVIAQGLAIAGCVTNIINMIVFVKMGLQDSSNVSFFAISVSDFGSSFTCLIACVGLSLWVWDLDLPFDPGDLQYVITGTPNLVFTKITTIITAFMTLERCVCVVKPLKVKSIFTGKRVKIFVIIISLIIVLTSVPFPWTYRLKMKFYPARNETRLGLVYTNERAAILNVAYPLYNVLYSLVPFVFISVCTGVLVASLQRKTAWRRTATSSSKAASPEDDVSSREKKISLMVILISCWFIACYLPNVVLHMLMLVDKDLSLTGAKASLLYSVFSFILVLSTLNSTVNVAIYYANSSAYKAAFNTLIFARWIRALKKKPKSGESGATV